MQYLCNIYLLKLFFFSPHHMALAGLGVNCIDQTTLQRSASASQVLVSKVCTTIPGLIFEFYFLYQNKAEMAKE